MAHFYRLTAFLCFLYPSLCFSEIGAVDLAGWIKGADGTYSKAFTNADGTSSRISLTSAPKGITTTSTALVQTSKGITAMDIVKTANVNTARLGSAMVGLAKKAGPVGMTLTAAALVCELTDICNQAGQWMMNPPAPSYEPNSYPASNGQWTAWGSRTVATPEGGCRDAERITVSVGSTTEFTFDHIEYIDDNNYKCFAKRITGSGVFYASNTSKIAGCAPGYTLSGANCLKNGVTPVPATNTDLDNAASKLNDDRVTPHLIEADEPLPTDSVPTLTPGQKKGLGLDSVPTKDSNGNVTGREDTMTEIEAVDAGTSDNPGRVIIKETKTTIKYDTNNTQISSTTNTSYTNQPDTKQPSGFTISFDTVPEATLPTYNVPNTFGSTSWGSGSCPPNIDVPLLHMTMHIPTQPVCDTAVMINPFVLLISTLIGIYIIAGVRGGSTT